MFLSDMREGECGTVVSVSAPENISRRASYMGISKGSEIYVLSVSGGDYTVISSGVRIAVGKGLAGVIEIDCRRNNQ